MIAKTKFTNLFTDKEPLILDSGDELESIKVAYQTFGTLSDLGDNVIMVNHALTGNAHVAGIIDDEEIENCKKEIFLTRYNEMYKGKEGWWGPLIGPGLALDTDKYCIICSNVIGSCYGTSIENNQFHNNALPYHKVTVRDMVKVQKKLFDELGITKIKLAVGGSLGGMQILEWAIMYGEMVESIMPIATSAAHSPWAIGLNEASRNAIKNDLNWNNGNYTQQPKDGLELARKIAMLTYRSYESFNLKFGRSTLKTNELFEVESYLKYQGEKLTKRFDANTYLCLSEAMDNHDVSHGRSDINTVLKSISCKTKCIGISSDILYPPSEQKDIASMIPDATYSEIQSIHGHDAFLIEFDQLDKIIRDFLG